MNESLSASVVLVGMSVREVQSRDLLLEVAHEVGANVAFLQMGDPSVACELTRLADLGAERVVLVGVSLGTLAPAASWLRRIAGHWLRQRAGRRPVLEVATHLADGPAQVPAVLALLRAVTGTEAGLESAAWETCPVIVTRYWSAGVHAARPWGPTGPLRR